MILHSESYLRRINNPHHLVKPIEEHVAHFQKRLKERFNLEVTEAEYFELVKNINHATLIYKTNASNGLYSFNIKGKEVWGLYSKGDKDRIVARLKTVLIPYQGLLVPDSLNHVFNHTMFFEKVKSFVRYVKSISNQLDLNNKKEFFIRQDIDQHIKAGVTKYKEKFNDPKLELILLSIGVKYLIVNAHRLHELPI